MAQYQEESRKNHQGIRLAAGGGNLQKEMKENGPVAAIKWWPQRGAFPSLPEVSRKNG